MSLCQFLTATGDNPGLVEQCERGLALIAGQDAPVEFVAFTTYLSKAIGQSRPLATGPSSDLALSSTSCPQLPYSAYLIDAYFWAVLWCRFTKQVQWGFDLIETVIDEALRQQTSGRRAQLYWSPKLFLHETIGDSALVRWRAL